MFPVRPPPDIAITVQSRVVLAQFDESFEPVHLGHDDVGDDEVEGASPLSRSRPIRPFSASVTSMATTFQHLAHDAAHRPVILDQTAHAHSANS